MITDRHEYARRFIARNHASIWEGRWFPKTTFELPLGNIPVGVTSFTLGSLLAGELRARAARNKLHQLRQEAAETQSRQGRGRFGKMKRHIRAGKFVEGVEGPKRFTADEIAQIKAEEARWDAELASERAAREKASRSVGGRVKQLKSLWIAAPRTIKVAGTIGAGTTALGLGYAGYRALRRRRRVGESLLETGGPGCLRRKMIVILKGKKK